LAAKNSDFSWKTISKIILIAVSGVLTGGTFAIYISKFLGSDFLDWFSYVPEEDEDDEKSIELDSNDESDESSLVGDFRFNMNFHWSEKDGVIIEMEKQKLMDTLETLNDTISIKQLSGLDYEESDLLKTYIKSEMDLLNRKVMNLRGEYTIESNGWYDWFYGLLGKKSS